MCGTFRGQICREMLNLFRLRVWKKRKEARNLRRVLIERLTILLHRETYLIELVWAINGSQFESCMRNKECNVYWPTVDGILASFCLFENVFIRKNEIDHHFLSATNTNNTNVQSRSLCL